MLSDKQKTALVMIAAVFVIAIDRLLKSMALAGLFDLPVNIIKNLLVKLLTSNIL
jgi:hypothetical protein